MAHTYKVGTDVFCFEPDETKEKLIYNARILEQSGFEISKDKKTPLYFVHFLGWNAKWDRIVSQKLILPNIVFYKELKDKIDKVVREKIPKQLRHDLIDAILEFASEVTNEKTTELTGVEPKLNKIRRLFYANNPKKLNTSILHTTDSSLISNYINPIVNSESDEINNPTAKASDNQSLLNLDTDGTVLDKLITKQNDPMHRSFMPPDISLTSKQLDIIKKSDCKPIPMLIDNTVCGILQTYLDSFPHTPCVKSSIHRKNDIYELSLQYEKADLSRQLAYEVCLGLRTIFDAYCPLLLLTPDEKALDRHTDKLNNLDLSNIPYKNHFSIYPEVIDNKIPHFPPFYSLVYGYSHLLRLLYLLPHKILPKFTFPTLSHEVVLHRHLSFIIKFFDEQNDRFTRSVTNKRKTETEDKKLSAFQPQIVLVRNEGRMNFS